MKRNGQLLLLTLCLPAFTQSPPASVAVESTSIKATANEQAQIEIVLRNRTEHHVTAYSWIVGGTYPDGSAKSHTGTTDLIGAVDFPPGGTNTFEDTLPTVNGYTPVITASLAMVVFDNGTAIGDKDKIAMIAVTRKRMAEERTKELAEIEMALRAESPVEYLKAYLDRRSIEDPNTKGPRIAGQIFGLLKSGVPISKIDSLLYAVRDQLKLIQSQSVIEVK